MGRAVAKPVRVYDREAMMMEFAPWINFSVDKIRDQSRFPVDREDLLAAAITGLLEAMSSYDPTVDRSFRSFAERSIQRAILDELKPAADFFQHVELQPIGPAEAVRHSEKSAHGYDRRGHKHKMH